MTRIIAGEFGGRRLVLPRDARVRPTADRVREAWMSILADRIEGARVLDLFAGSGALGLEALSRGAAHATFVDVGRAAITAIRKNAAALGVEPRIAIHHGDAVRFVEHLPPGEFDIALADPPFTVPHAVHLMERFVQRPFARLLVVEHPARMIVSGDHSRRYGDIALTFRHAP